MTTPAVTLESIQVATPTIYRRVTRDGFTDQWVSAIDKQKVDGPVTIELTGLVGDQQADRESHGGIDKAVLAYAADHYRVWRDELPQHPWRYGGFGENLTIHGLDESNVCLGDLYRIGEVQLEVTQPRQPCWKLCARWGQPDLARRVVKTARSGWYLRVSRRGHLQAGQPVELIDRPLPEWTIARASGLMFGQISDRQAAEELSRLTQVSLVWREELMQRQFS